MQPRPHERQFVNYLRTLGDERSPDRAALASLRRGLRGRPSTTAELHRYVARWIPEEMSQREADAYYLVAALYASHPVNWETDPGRYWRSNFGASFRRLRTDEGESAERRFVALLNSHRDDLPYHLRHAVSLLRSHDIPIDWAQLLRDIKSWGHPDRYVQTQWARSFWAPLRENGDGEETADDAMTEAAGA